MVCCSFPQEKNGRSLSVNGTYGPILESKNTRINNDDILKQFMPIANGMHNTAPVRIKNLDKRNPLIVCLNRANPEKMLLAYAIMAQHHPVNQIMNQQSSWK
ncbi:hypothetical protein [Photorhabdus heterorhabditis]|uniref:Uncharacterized protein n=1 Tax=Photorhabdus heterorhabditis TaxID=880156 RepID=A0ABR5K7K2_9GAMM|nr:hypothetical protein [Photorhabdus heterorhabditis]KOY60541.1 hypothetical protein AM629_18810 [Photorhabdus heterorhabditis]